MLLFVQHRFHTTYAELQRFVATHDRFPRNGEREVLGADLYKWIINRYVIYYIIYILLHYIVFRFDIDCIISC